MQILERLKMIVAVVPSGTVIQLPVDQLREWLEEDGLQTLTAGAPAAPPTSNPTPPAAVVDLTVADLAQAIGRAESTVRAWCAAGDFPGAYRLNRKEWRVPRSGLEAFQAAQRTPPPPSRLEPMSARALAKAMRDL